MKKSILWVMRLLVLLGCGLMIYSFLNFWWSVNLSNIPWQDPIQIYAFGFRHSLTEMAPYVERYATPAYQTVIAYIYLVFSVILALGSTFLKGKKRAFIIGGVGLAYLAYAIATIFVIKAGIPRISSDILGYSGGNVPIPLQGSYSIGASDWSMVTVTTAFHPAYYMAYAAGGIFVILPLIYLVFERHNNRRNMK
jgi:hypothetical protein